MLVVTQKWIYLRQTKTKMIFYTSSNRPHILPMKNAYFFHIFVVFLIFLLIAQNGALFFHLHVACHIALIEVFDLGLLSSSLDFDCKSHIIGVCVVAGLMKVCLQNLLQI